MFNEFSPPGPLPGARRSVDELAAGEARVLWALRRLALMQPLGTARCHAVHIALHREFGDAGQGLEHLLRCWLVGLSRRARRPLAIGTPACPLLTDDEAVLIGVLRRPDGRGAAALVGLTGTAEAAALLPLFAAIGVLIVDS